MKDVYQIIRNIRLSEKAALAHAVKTVFGKKVDHVRTMNYDGKARRKRTKQAGYTSAWKKAVVRLAPGEKIDLT
jgi:large subunit ribosomal protein L23